MLKFLPTNEGFQIDLIRQSYKKLQIGIIDADLLDHGTRHPNLALLKISAFCKDEGHKVRLITNYDELSFNSETLLINSSYDVLILSKVFKFTNIPDFIIFLIKQHYIFYGGTGFFEVNGEYSLVL